MKNLYKNWDEISIKYDRYITESENEILQDFIKKEKNALFSLLDENLQKSDIIVIEIGSGTGRLLFEIAEKQLKKNSPHKIRCLIGVDVSSMMTKLAKKKHQDIIGKKELPASWENKIQFFKYNGNALEKLIKRKKINFQNATVIVICVLNTLGIIYPNERLEVIQQMIKVAGEHGKVFISVFNANSFKDTAYAIYEPITNMIGPIDDKNSFNNSSPDVKSKIGYYSHWFEEREIINLIKNSLKRTSITEKNLNHIDASDMGIIIQLI